MKRKVLVAIFSSVALMTALIIPVSASTPKTPAQACADVTGQSLITVIEARKSGQRYGEIALNAGKLDEFKAMNLNVKKEKLNNTVANGTISQSDADKKLEIIKLQQENCDGIAPMGIGRGNGEQLQDGSKSGTGIGNGGTCKGQGVCGGNNGSGRGNGEQLQDGSKSGTGIGNGGTGKGQGAGSGNNGSGRANGEQLQDGSKSGTGIGNGGTGKGQGAGSGNNGSGRGNRKQLQDGSCYN